MLRLVPLPTLMKGARRQRRQVAPTPLWEAMVRATLPMATAQRVCVGTHWTPGIPRWGVFAKTVPDVSKLRACARSWGRRADALRESIWAPLICQRRHQGGRRLGRRQWGRRIYRLRAHCPAGVPYPPPSHSPRGGRARGCRRAAAAVFPCLATPGCRLARRMCRRWQWLR